MLKIKNINTYYGQVHALKNVSLHVNPGEIVSLPEGVKPGDKLVEVDDAGNPVVKKAAEIAKTEQAKTDAKADEKPKQ